MHVTTQLFQNFHGQQSSHMCLYHPHTLPTIADPDMEVTRYGVLLTLWSCRKLCTVHIGSTYPTQGTDFESNYCDLQEVVDFPCQLHLLLSVSVFYILGNQSICLHHFIRGCTYNMIYETVYHINPMWF